MKPELPEQTPATALVAQPLVLVPGDWKQASFIYDRAPDAIRRTLMRALIQLSPPGRGDLLMGMPHQMFEQAALRLGLNQGPAPKLTLEDYESLTREFGPQRSADDVGRPEPGVPSVIWQQLRGQGGPTVLAFMLKWWTLAAELVGITTPIVQLAPAIMPTPQPEALPHATTQALPAHARTDDIPNAAPTQTPARRQATDP